jgi:hypothetical protein
MSDERLIREAELVSLAKRYRVKAKKTRARAAREMGVSQTAIFHAEESPQKSLAKLRVRMIEAYSPFTVVNALFLRRKRPR